MTHHMSSQFAIVQYVQSIYQVTMSYYVQKRPLDDHASCGILVTPSNPMQKQRFLVLLLFMQSILPQGPAVWVFRSVIRSPNKPIGPLINPQKYILLRSQQMRTVFACTQKCSSHRFILRTPQVQKIKSIFGQCTK